MDNNVVRTRREAREHQPARDLGHFLRLGVSLGILGIVILLGVMVIVVPKIAGATPMTILTSSMEPSLPPGTLIIVKPIEPQLIAIGDVLTYQIRSGDPAVVTHRVIGVTSSSNGEVTWTTKGDNNSMADPDVTTAQIRGTVWYSVPLLGWVNTVVNGESRAWLIPLIAGGLFLYAGYMGASGITGAAKRRRERTASIEAVADASVTGTSNHERWPDAAQRLGACSESHETFRT